MASFRLVNRLKVRGLVVLTLLLACFNEILVYYLNSSTWPQIECKSENCTRLLLIADPQLLGSTFDRSFYSHLARLDADRYLQKTFERSLVVARPHIVCFLGDLLDEGSLASPQEFQGYVQRFRDIYRTDDRVRRIHVPGDNDIGGENGEYISNSNLRRFDAAFAQEDVFDYDQRVRFFKINRMLLNFSNPDRDHNAQRMRVGLSHAPLLIGGGPLLRAVLSDLDPHVIFSGHWHESRIFLHPSTKVIQFYERAVRRFDLKALKEQQHSYLEIMVPTASYRMGKPNIGIGFAVLENSELRYTVLWLPNRFVCLFVYLFWSLFVLSGCIVFHMMTRCPCRVAKRQSSYARLSPAAP